MLHGPVNLFPQVMYNEGQHQLELEHIYFKTRLSNNLLSIAFIGKMYVPNLRFTANHSHNSLVVAINSLRWHQEVAPHIYLSQNP